MNDENIVDLFLNKDENAIVYTKEKYGIKLNRIAYNILFNKEDSDECESDTYLAAWGAIPPKSPKTYLFSFLAKIIRNLSINLYNKSHTQKRNANIYELTKELEECIPSPNDDYLKLEESDFTLHLNSFFKTLKDDDRNIFILRYWYSYSIKEISFKYGISESKTKSLLFRTRNKLKLYFNDKGVIL